MKKILVCEDEDAIRDFVVINLKRADYEVVDVNSGELALLEFKKALRDTDESNRPFDVALLDIMMPGMDGTELCRLIREESNSIGIIMLSAKTQEMDKITCLTIGADDYVTKPFSPSELVARVDAIYRRVSLNFSAAGNGRELISGPFAVNTKSRVITKNGEPIDLTQVEYQIMEYFIKNGGVALDRKSILMHIWGDGYFGDDKIVDVNIRRLRMKVEKDPSVPVFIQTVWGYGYKWTATE
ncbi:MAG: response regulator transcription factor [Oscillospiraceae bacterium]|jgi:DNA-binding response OmpR family regulator|nr:response regulator transcription factor [Oscillospiraceae bacterium]